MLSLRSLISTYYRWRIQFEIGGRLSPQVRGERDNGYPFDDDDSLAEVANQGHEEAQRLLAAIEADAPRMGEAYCQSFRYIMYRDLNQRLVMYLRIIRKNRNGNSETCDPRFVARKA